MVKIVALLIKSRFLCGLVSMAAVGRTYNPGDEKESEI